MKNHRGSDTDMTVDPSATAPAVPVELRRLSEMEIGFMRRRNDAIQQLLSGQGVPPDALQTVTFELLPQCRRARESLASLPPAVLPPALTPLLVKYVQWHEEAWQALAGALQSGDAALVHQHETLLEQAQRLLHEVSPAGEPAGPRHELRQFRNLLFALTPHVWAIPTLLALNVIVWISMIVAGASPLSPLVETMLKWGANYGPLTLNGQGWRMATCMFLHFGLLHIGFNMYVLWQLGRLVERLVGNWGLLILYMATGIAASIASLAWNPAVVSAGASGAVFGVCGALLGFIALRRDTIPRVVLMDLKSSLITFVVYNVAFGVVVPAIDMAAHLGGLVYGVLCGLVLSQPLVPGARQRRWRRNLACLVGSALVLPLAFSLLPAPPPDVNTSVANIEQANQRVKTRYQQLDQQLQQGQLTPAAYADAVTSQVLPIVDEALRETHALSASPTIDRAGLKSLEQYLTLRQQSLQWLARGVREDNAQAVQQHRLSWLQADTIEQKLFPLE
jgi:rhomboid protease GluP